MRRREFLESCGAAAVATCAPTWASGATPDAAKSAAATSATTTSGAKPYRVIDTHVHLFNARAMNDPGVQKIDYLTLDATVEGCVEAMRAGGVQKGFLITYNAADVAAQLRLYKLDPAAVRLVYNTAYQKAAWKKHPDLFWWFPDHIDPARETYLEDLEKDFAEGAAGIKLLPIFHGFFPDHPGFIPVYEMCRKYRKPIILDLSFWYLEVMPPMNELEHRRNRVTRFSDYAKLLDPIFREFSDVPISLAHTGTAHREADFDEIFPCIAKYPNVYCDIAASTNSTGGELADFVQKLVKAVGSHKIMYGTDWPYWSNGKMSYLKGSRRWTIITENCPGLSEADKRMILSENAERFVRFKLPQSTAGKA